MGFQYIKQAVCSKLNSAAALRCVLLCVSDIPVLLAWSQVPCKLLAYRLLVQSATIHAIRTVVVVTIAHERFVSLLTLEFVDSAQTANAAVSHYRKTPATAVVDD